MGISEQIYEYATSIKSIPEKSVDEIKKRIADSVFTAYASRNAEPIKISKTSLLPSAGKLNSHIYFSNETASSEISSFINGSMTRYMDYNDTYLSKEAIHPSDNIAPILAIAEPLAASGYETLKAIWLSYQIACALADASSIRKRGWDHVVYISISSAVGIAYLLGLDKKKFINAISLAINNNISMRQTRVGTLSMWKGCTVGDAARNSVFAALLAKNGLTGPSPIFEGEMGLFKQVSGKFSLRLGKELAQKTMIKAYPVEYHAMSAVEAALSIRGSINGKIKSITIETFNAAYEIIAKGKEKLRPKNKETADHSLQYITAYTLLYGEPNVNSYSKRFLSDKKILSLIDKTKVRVSQKLDKLYPEYTPVRISVKTDSGDFSKYVKVQKGHKENPFTWEELEAKGIRCMGNAKNAKMVITTVKSLDKINILNLVDVISNANTKR
ncbi:MAG: MmgE/PrpD family protein [Methanothrix sp.]